jgi:membrane associated rhomboid family serine protease
MIPLGHDNSLRKVIPVMTYVLILLNILVFLLELKSGKAVVIKWAFIPSHFIADPASNAATIFTAMFMHASWGHLIGNMLYLWIFGDDVEERVGRIKFLLFYLVCGIAATLSQLAIDPKSHLPNLGASGAIAGVLGAYLLFFPSRKINILLGPFITQLPALIVIGFWFLLQFFSGFVSIEEMEGRGETDGIAYMAHIGGFITGLLIAILLRATEKVQL